MSDSWKTEGGKKINNIIDSTKDITNKYYNTDSTLNVDDKEGIYFYKENGPSVVGFGTKTPYSRLSFGDYEVNNIVNGVVKDESLVNNACIALSEKSDGSNATGMSFYRDRSGGGVLRGIIFTINNNPSGTVRETSLSAEDAAIQDNNTSMIMLNDGVSQKVLINSNKSKFANAGSGLEVNGDIRLTKNLIFDTNQKATTVNKEEGTIFYDSVDKKMKWITGTGADIHTIFGTHDTAFAINTDKYDPSFAVVTNTANTVGLLAFKDLGFCIGNGEMVVSSFVEEFGDATKQNLPALSVIGHHQNGLASNGNILVTDIDHVTGEAILSKTSPIDISANGVIYLQNNLTIGKYQPEAVIDVSKINVPFLSMGSDITNYYNSVVIGEDISGTSSSFYFGKSINNLAPCNQDASFNFVFGDTISIDSDATSFNHNLIFGSNLDVSGNNNLVFGQNLSIGPDVSFCIVLGKGSGSAQKGDLIKYFENGNSVFHLKSGGNLILTGDISANDAVFNDVVFSNIGNETSKIKLAYVKGISAENVSIENSLTINGKLNSTSDISANDVSFNNIDINNLKSYGDFVVNGNIDTTGYANIGGDISANDASFNNVDINNLKSYGNAVINGNIDTTGNANFGGDISANDASFNSININIGDINELENVQKINFDSTSNLVIQKFNKDIVTITNEGMDVAGDINAISLSVGGNIFDATASGSWVSGNSKNYTGTSNGLYIPLKVGINFTKTDNVFFPKFPIDVSGVIRSQNQVLGDLSIDLVPQPLLNYTNTITNDFYGSGIYDASENDINETNPVWKLFDYSSNTFWESTGNVDTVEGISGGYVQVIGKYLEIKLPERCTLKHYAFKSTAVTKLPKVWTIIGKIGLNEEVLNPEANNMWKIIDYKSLTVSDPSGADGEFVYFTVDKLKYSNDMYKVFRIYITETFIGTTVGTASDNQCQISELKLFGEPSNITDISSSLIQTELFDVGALFKQKHLSLQPMGGNVGIRTNNPSVILDISANNAIRLPMGNSTTRPPDADASGCLRYNTDTKQFEGYGDAGWAGLGGVIDKDQDTKILAEENSGENKLRFYTKGVERMVINDNGVVDVSGLLQSKEISGNSVNATLLKTDGLIINNKTIVQNSIVADHVNKSGYFDIFSDEDDVDDYDVNGFPSSSIYAYPGSVLQFNLDGVSSTHPFNIFINYEDSATGTSPSGLQHVADDGTITNNANGKYDGSLIWFVPYDAIGFFRYQCGTHEDMNGLIEILPMPSDVSANDISGGNVYANSLTSNGIAINGNISGNQATFYNGIINTKLGIGTPDPMVSLDVVATDAIRIPAGNDTLIGVGGQKPPGQDGMIRYNNVSNQFEGYGSGAWAGLGGVIDKDLDTKILADISGNNDNKLRFITQGTEKMIITDSDNSGNIGIGTQTPSVTLDISSNNAIRLPMGNTNEQPSDADARGCLRYNTETKQFEGYGEGSWGGLGGVISIDMKTKITALDTGLTFFTDGQKRMNIASNGNIDISSAVFINNNLDCSSAVIKNLTSDSTYVTDLSCSELDISGILKTDGLIINNKTIVKNSIVADHVNKSGYFDIFSDEDDVDDYDVNGFPSSSIYAYPGSVLQFNLDGVSSTHPFNIFINYEDSATGTSPSGLQHVADDGTITNNANGKYDGSLIWFVPYDAIGFFRYQCGTHEDMNGLIEILPMPSDVSANDISGGNIYANTLTISGDLSGNNAFLHDVSVNRLWIGNVEMIGHIPGAIGDEPNTGTLTGNMIIKGDLSANDASFNVVDISNLFVGGINIGTQLNSKQASNDRLSEIAGLVPTANNFIVGGGSNFVLKTALEARTSLGLGTLAVESNINDGDWSGNDLSIVNGGTGASTASGARTNLELGNVTNETKETMFTSPVFTGNIRMGDTVLTATATELNYVDVTTSIQSQFTSKQASNPRLSNIAGLAVTANNFIVGDGGSFILKTPASARTSLGLGTLATLDSIHNGYWSGTDLSVVNGGTGASTASGARTNLGLGTLATLDSINNGYWSGTDLSVVNGGTGASSALSARTNLGLGSSATLNITNTSNWSVGSLETTTLNTTSGFIPGTNYQAGFYAHINAGLTSSSYNWSSYMGGYTLKVHKSIWCNGGALVVTSDRRIKKNIVDISDNGALEMVRNIPCRYYNYIDGVNNANSKILGFIAQEVEEVFPIAVNTSLTEYIPDEYRVLNEKSWETDGSKNKLTTDLNDVSGVKYRFYVSNKEDNSDEEQKEIIGNADNTFTFDTSYNTVFCYGKQVHDLRALCKDKLFALNFSATQEIDRVQQAEKTKLATAEAKLATAEAKLAAAEAEINTLKTKNLDLETIVANLITQLKANNVIT